MPDAYQAASAYLASLDSDWQRHIAAVGPCLHQPHPARDPYESLVRAIAYQQLHAKAGDAIVGRLVGLFPSQSFPRPEQILATDFERMRSCGFSAQVNRCHLTHRHRWQASSHRSLHRPQIPDTPKIIVGAGLPAMNDNAV